MTRKDKFPFVPTKKGAAELRFWNLFQGAETKADPRIQRLLIVLDIIDVKAGPLVSYNGLLLVIATILIGNAQTFSAGAKSGILILLFVLMLIMSLVFALSTIYIIGSHSREIMKYTDEEGRIETPEVAVNILADIVCKRRDRYMIAFRLAAFSTVLLGIYLALRLSHSAIIARIFSGI